MNPNLEEFLGEDALAVIDANYSSINSMDVVVGEFDHDFLYIGYLATISHKQERVRTNTMFHY